MHVGSANTEVFHKHLMESIPRTIMALDQLVDFLAGEDKYWERIVATTQLWDAKQKQVKDAKKHYAKKRHGLACYMEKDNNLDRASTEDIDVMALLEAEFEEKEKEYNKDEKNNTAGNKKEDIDDDIINLVDMDSQPRSSLPVPPSFGNHNNNSKSLWFTQYPTCKKIKVPLSVCWAYASLVAPSHKRDARCNITSMPKAARKVQAPATDDNAGNNSATLRQVWKKPSVIEKTCGLHTT
jgi:hypothetical protein